ncbi:DNA alkylation repair protein [Dyadobacter psychrotolerans]|uniref:DNA alkylation repair protein n=1 Tax=Dyadobacter psychrotolerans TaxID=2541721 RepID=A0A4R5DLW4_9BACT|nr:DNA alkylation repair protein [Dyadobacter psychrotolerans]TDE14437.1 DNA alkylation repair protein [Dyadobacter psychrotolerans]
MSLIKDIYSPSFYDRFANTMAVVIPSFDKKNFIEKIFTDEFKTLEWKERMKHTTRVFYTFLPENYPQAINIIEKIIDQLRADNFGEDGLAFVFLADYIESYGLDDFETSVKALEIVTRFISCEFAVRPFIIKYGNRMIDQMVVWSKHKNHKVRRFACEGSRPRLPWAMAIPALKKDPKPLIPLLENLKADPSEFVRRSVANNINDIAKDHPDIVIALAERWKGISRETDAIIKHGSRTLLKQGHTEILKHYGLVSEQIAVADLTILTPEVKIGDSLGFTFNLENQGETPQTVRLEYGIYYRKAKGHLARKVFKISEKTYLPGETIKIHRKQSFRIITTKVFYIGQHELSVIVNGEEKGKNTFEVLEG